VELTTIAKPYANAVFEIAQHNKSHAHWRGVLEVGASVANDATMRAFVASPNSTKANKAKTIVAIFPSALDRAFRQQEKTFIDLLLENERWDALQSIMELFDAMSNLSSDAKAFHVISAYKLNKKEEDHIARELKHFTKLNISQAVHTNNAVTHTDYGAFCACFSCKIKTFYLFFH
jgi:F-type H+-transporting ATPase subunit delta